MVLGPGLVLGEGSAGAAVAGAGFCELPSSPLLPDRKLKGLGKTILGGQPHYRGHRLIFQTAEERHQFSCTTTSLMGPEVGPVECLPPGVQADADASASVALIRAQGSKTPRRELTALLHWLQTTRLELLWSLYWLNWGAFGQVFRESNFTTIGAISGAISPSRKGKPHLLLLHPQGQGA